MYKEACLRCLRCSNPVVKYESDDSESTLTEAKCIECGQVYEDYENSVANLTQYIAQLKLTCRFKQPLSLESFDKVYSLLCRNSIPFQDCLFESVDNFLQNQMLIEVACVLDLCSNYLQIKQTAIVNTLLKR